MNLLTVFGYSWVWFYKNWEDLHQWAKTLTEEEINQIAGNEEQRKILKYLAKMNVMIHSLALLAEWIRLFFSALLFWQIAKLHPKPSFPSRHALLFGLTLMAVLEESIRLYATVDIRQMMIAVILGTIPQMVAQVYLNDFWKKVEPTDLPLRQRFTANEYTLIALGAGSIGIILSGLIQPMPLPPDALHNVAPEIFGK